MSFELVKNVALVVGVAVLAAVPVIVPFTGFYPTYSDGERVGVITKVSEKGLVVKSVEATMTLSGAGGVDAASLAYGQQFSFSARPNTKVAIDIENAMKTGKPVIVHYNQWYAPPKVFIETQYEAKDVVLAK